MTEWRQLMDVSSVDELQFQAMLWERWLCLNCGWVTYWELNSWSQGASLTWTLSLPASGAAQRTLQSSSWLLGSSQTPGQAQEMSLLPWWAMTWVCACSVCILSTLGSLPMWPTLQRKEGERHYSMAENHPCPQETLVPHSWLCSLAGICGMGQQMEALFLSLCLSNKAIIL